LPLSKLVLDSNCFIDAARDSIARSAFESFCAAAAPRLYLSSVVAGELLQGARNAGERRDLERHVIKPYLKRGRVLAPSAQAWLKMGETLSTLHEQEGLVISEVKRNFMLDILIAYSCREAGATLVSRNARDMVRIAGVFGFDYADPYPPV
jgi:predicted nucleic acid-binding protein